MRSAASKTESILNFPERTNSHAQATANGDRPNLRSGSDDGLINILIVDDEPKNLTVLETVLNNPAYRLVKAESADQALLALLVDQFALLILDIRMPGVTGIYLAQVRKRTRETYEFQTSAILPTTTKTRMCWKVTEPVRWITCTNR
jgi:PleD family two-component response regulator